MTGMLRAERVCVETFTGLQVTQRACLLKVVRSVAATAPCAAGHDAGHGDRLPLSFGVVSERSAETYRDKPQHRAMPQVTSGTTRIPLSGALLARQLDRVPCEALAGHGLLRGRDAARGPGMSRKVSAVA